jgi:hypothetical protein
MRGGAKVVILSRASQWGLAKDSSWVEQVLREIHATRNFPIASIDHLDPVTFTNPQPVDIQIHLEVPCRLAFPWAKINIVVVNPEWWQRDAWNWALAEADFVVFKHRSAPFLFPDVDSRKVVVIPWRSPTGFPAVPWSAKQRRFLYLVGGSVNKAAVVAAWRPEWPPLEVWGTPAIMEDLKTVAGTAGAAENIVWNTEYRSEKDTVKAQTVAAFHVTASAAEGFGYTMAECVAAGSLPLWTDIPAYSAAWGSVLGSVGRIPMSGSGVGDSVAVHREAPQKVVTPAIAAAVESLLALTANECRTMVKSLQEEGGERTSGWRAGWRSLLRRLPLTTKAQPLVLRRLKADELPRVGVVTVTRDRPRWFTNMSRNILLADYPRDRLVWIVVDDGEGVGRIDEQVARFREANADIQVEYVSLPPPKAGGAAMPVGEKRNRGCSAGARMGCDVFAMMDDDDHYQKSSLIARVSYIALGGRPCVYCSRIQMYDTRRYISAMNVPPLDLAPAARVSEATLTFTRGFWEARGFPPTMRIAEGEAFLVGREGETMEVPPEGVIVSFIHGGNSTSRRVPEEQEANGCHYGFDDAYFTYLSGM